MAKQKLQIVSKKGLTRHQQEEVYRHQIVLALGGVVGLIVLVLVIGSIYSYIIRPRQTIAIVGDERITRQDYQNRVLYERYLLDEQDHFTQAQAAQMLENFADNPDFQDSIKQQAQTRRNQIKMQYFNTDRDALERLIEEALVAQKAMQEDIRVDDLEVEEAYQTRAALRNGGYTEAAVQKTVTAREDATATAELFTPTPTSTPNTPEPVLNDGQVVTPTLIQEEVVTGTLRLPPKPSAIVTNTRQVSETVGEAVTGPLRLLEAITGTLPTSDTLVAEDGSSEEVIDRPTPAPTPTFNTITGDALTQAVSNWESLMLEQADLLPQDLRKLIERDLLRQKLIKFFTETLEPTALQVKARHILVQDITEAHTVTARLAAGEDFAALALELSQDPGSRAQGGDLGWFTEGAMVAPFNDAAFSLKLETVSEPIQTEFGWHIIEVLAREDRELEEAALEQKGFEAYQDWLKETRLGVQDFWSVDDAP